MATVNESSRPGLNPSQKVRLADLVQNTPDSILSRTIHKNSVGNITLFAFGKGQGLSPHSAPYDAFVTVMEGEGEVVIEDKPYRLTAGEAIIMPANVPHAVNATSDFKMMLVMIRGDKA
jgi:quercetin dioxygenase-like cupin family protein